MDRLQWLTPAEHCSDVWSFVHAYRLKHINDKNTLHTFFVEKRKFIMEKHLLTVSNENS